MKKARYIFAASAVFLSAALAAMFGENGKY